MSKIARYALAILCIGALPLYAQTKKVTRRPMAKKTEAVSSDVSRLSAILIDTQNQKSTIPDQAWRLTANEANSLANHIYAATGGSKASSELRTHIREMQSAANSGDANGARSHAGMALPFVYQLSD